MHKTPIWERTRTTQRLRHALREYFPAALQAFEDLDAADTLELLAKAPDPLPGRPGCAFHPRCPQAEPICSRSTPPWEGRDGHQVMCHSAWQKLVRSPS